MALLWWELGAVALGAAFVLVSRWRRRQETMRLWLATRPGPISTKPPTVAELNAPNWLSD